MNFGDVSSSTFGDTTTEIRYTGVASGINASLTTAAPFAAQTPANHGSVLDDVRINMTAAIGSTASNIVNSSVFTLSLWDALAGDGFSTLYTNVEDYEWSVVFYDIDAGTPSTTGANSGVYTYDYVRLISPGGYRVVGNTDLLIETLGDGSVSFSGINAGAVAGQDGLTTLTIPQRQVTVAYELFNLSSIQFEYAALRANSEEGNDNLGSNLGSGRNLLVDGGELSTELGNNTVTGTVAPEPGTALLAGLSAMLLTLRRKRG